MEFTYINYIGRLVLNPNDFILRFENKENFRVYERSYFEREFVEYTPLGGLDFIGRMLSTAFHPEKKLTQPLSIRDFTSSANLVEFTLQYSNPLLSKSLDIHFKIPAIRKENAGADVEDINRRMKALNESVEKKILQLENTVKSLEERCGNTIVFPGCDFVIPADITSLKLIKNNTASPEDCYYSTVYPAMKMHTSHQWPTFSIGHPFGNQHVSANWQPDKESYVHNGLKSLDNLKYLRSMTLDGYNNGRVTSYVLTLTGTSLIHDYSPIGNLTRLTSLTICSARATSYPNNILSNTSVGDNPPLQDISWIHNLKQLEHVCFLGCTSLVDITPLKDLPNLKRVDIRETGVKNTEFLSSKVEIKK